MFTTNPTWTALGQSLGLRDDNPATNRHVHVRTGKSGRNNQTPYREISDSHLSDYEDGTLSYGMWCRVVRTANPLFAFSFWDIKSENHNENNVSHREYLIQSTKKVHRNSTGTIVILFYRVVLKLHEKKSLLVPFNNSILYFPSLMNLLPYAMHIHLQMKHHLSFTT